MKARSAKTKPASIGGADKRLLEAARKALHEGQSFQEMYQSVAAANGLLELLSHLTGDSGEPADNVNWCAVANLVEECARRLNPAEAALYQLYEYERDQAGVANV